MALHWLGVSDVDVRMMEREHMGWVSSLERGLSKQLNITFGRRSEARHCVAMELISRTL